MRSPLLAALVALLLQGCGNKPVPAKEPQPTRNATLEASIVEASIDDLQLQMTKGVRTSKEIVRLYLDRIEDMNRRGPELRAVIEVNPDALSIARALDEERRTKGSRGPLHGIPILLKDNIATADSMKTTAGSLFLVGRKAPRDSAVAARLRAAGAVILGKANLSEWANFRSQRSTGGWSARGGQTRNPYVLDRSPCGSSSGSGVATAASLAAAAIGTETDGSIVCPSSANGVVGIKPTVGLVSRAGIIPISSSQDTAGPMARSVRDAAHILTALVGIDERDPSTLAAKDRVPQDYASFLDKNGLKGARIGVSRVHFGADPNVDRLMEKALTTMRAQGAVTVDVTIPAFSVIAKDVLELMLYEFKAGLEEYLEELGDGPRTLQELIEFNERHRVEELGLFGQELLRRAQEKGGLDSPEYLRARERIQRITRSSIDETMKEHRLDAMVAPTGSPAWTLDVANGDHFVLGSASPASVAGYPNITVPAGQVFQLPVGISFFGRAFSEPTLLKIAYAFEQATMARRPPKYLPTLPLGTTP